MNNDRRWTFDGIPVRDATYQLKLTLLPDDYARSVPRDHEQCLLATAAKRALGSTVVEILHSIAYIEEVMEDGSRVIFRYTTQGRAKKVLEAFDRGEYVPTAQVIVLNPPTGVRRLEERRIHTKASDEKKRHALLNGQVWTVKKKPRHYDPHVRNGTGRIRMVPVSTPE